MIALGAGRCVLLGRGIVRCVLLSCRTHGASRDDATDDAADQRAKTGTTVTAAAMVAPDLLGG